jgi:phosphoglycolate phosphatase
MIKLVVCDFDGTLADTRTYWLDSVQAILKEFNYNFDYEHLYTHLGDFTLADTLSLMGVTKKDSTIMIKKVLFRVEKKLEKVKPCPGLKELGKIKQKKIILSNNFESYIDSFLKKQDADFFSEYSIVDNLQSKLPRLQQIIKKEKLSPKEIVYIGDKVADIKLAKKIGCHSVVIAHKSSWSSLSEIKKSRPEFIITKLPEVLQILSDLNLPISKAKK